MEEVIDAIGDDGSGPAAEASAVTPLEEMAEKLKQAEAQVATLQQQLQVCIQIINEVQEAQRAATNHTIRAVQVLDQVMQNVN